MAAGDLDGDDRADVVFAERDGVYAVVRPLEGSPVKKLVFVVVPDEYMVTQLEIEDLDNDGYGDLVVASIFDWVRVLPGKGDGTFGEGGRLTLTGEAPPLPNGCGGTVPCATAFREATLVDLDADGDLDIITAGRGLRVFRNDGGFVFTLTAESGSLGDDQATYAMITADAWRDGDVMRILAAGPHDWVAIGGPEEGGFAFALSSSDMVSWAVTGATVFNLEESTPDVVRVTTGFAGDAIACGTQRRVVDVDGVGAITLGDTLDFCPRLFGDVNGDGVLDMAPGGPDVGFVFGDGAGGFVENELSAAGPGGTGGTLGDLDGDGDAEVVSFAADLPP